MNFSLFYLNYVNTLTIHYVYKLKAKEMISRDSSTKGQSAKNEKKCVRRRCCCAVLL